MINYAFDFKLFTEIRMGDGISSQVGTELRKMGIKKVMVASDPGIIKVGIIDGVIDSLNKEAIDYVLFDQIVPNPRISHCEKGAEIGEKFGIEGIVAVGGGSSIDTGKAIGTIMTNKVKLVELCGSDKVKNRSLPVIAIPTTAGTGSEVTPFAVISDHEKKLKLNIFDLKVTPVLALLDPRLLISLPSHIMASTGIDALTHAIEAYTCKLATPITDSNALYAIKLINENIENAVNNPTIENCSNMLVASTIAGIAFGYSDVGGVHCLAEALGGFYDMPHGVANAIFLPLVFRENIESNPIKHSEVSLALGIPKGNMQTDKHGLYGAKYINDLVRRLKIPKLRFFQGVNEKDFIKIAKMATENVSAESNPKELSESDYLRLLKKAYR